MVLTSRRRRARSRLQKRGVISQPVNEKSAKHSKKFSQRWQWLLMGLISIAGLVWILQHIYPEQIRDFPLPDSYGLLVVAAAAALYTLGRWLGLKSFAATATALAAAAALSLHLQSVIFTPTLILALTLPPILSLLWSLRPSSSPS